MIHILIDLINQNISPKAEMIKLFKKYPSAPPLWLGAMACTTWNLEPVTEASDSSKYCEKHKQFGFEGTKEYEEDLSTEN